MSVNGYTTQGLLDAVEDPSSDLSLSLSSTYDARRVQSMVVFGDSLTEQGGMLPGYPESNAAARDIRAFSPWTWGNMLLGQAFRVLDNLGVGGNTTTQMVARMSAVTAYSPGWVHLIAGTNDVGSGTTTAIANITTMLTTFEAAGIRVVIGTIPPRAGVYTGTMRADTLVLNEWIRNLAYTRKNVVVVDYFSVLAEATVNSNYRSTIYGANPTSDNIHLSATGAYACGKALAAALRPYVKAPVPYSNPTPGANLLANPRPGLAAGGATLPSSWSLGGSGSGTVVWSDVARDDGGVWKQVVLADDKTLTMQSNFTVDSSRVSIGDYIAGFVEFDVSAMQAAPSSGKQISIAVKAWNGSSWFDSRYAFNNTAQPIDPRSGVLRTPWWPVPVGTTIISLYIELAGGMSFRFDKAGLYVQDTYAP